MDSVDKALPSWLSACAGRFDQVADAHRVPLEWHGRRIGSVHPALWPDVAPHWTNSDDAVATLQALARHLRGIGRTGPWRDEAVSVRDAEGLVVGAIERGVVRVLGIATEAVHLVGLAPDGRVWLQQRAFDKANDPGRWDTLMGGMVAHGESLDDTLARETWEEAGLRIADLRDLRWGRAFRMGKPTEDAGGLGQLVETIHWCVATLPDGVVPDNQDGEVAGFECVERDEAARRVLAGTCTDEAAWVLALALGWPVP
ncbi:NUDIX domain-containing protein [uncultured Hydrogenophaga sp.]|uniref:NUDIX domain-containing protein n=1 Tax=uncultured Hydrogenophaga sp. TaxID=199683 RepID=UPI00258725D9|nr:NUDIX domain-containing protein [uncultured Hydrogenophaga sp.]